VLRAWPLNPRHDVGSTTSSGRTTWSSLKLASRACCAWCLRRRTERGGRAKRSSLAAHW